MRREPLIGIVGLLLCVVPAVAQHSGIQFHGTPASVTSPGIDGRPRGIAASVTDPTFTTSLTNAGHVPGNFAGHHHHRSTPVFAVPYYGYYGLPSYDSSEYEQSQPQQPPPPQVIVIREESSSSNTGDEDSHYGEHSFNSLEENRESSHDRAPQAQLAPAPKVAEEELLPMTTLVYRDGHKSEVRNYAIVGGNLIDLTKSPVMKKIPLDSLDLVATRHENEENGVDFHLP
jgi:hypothetical protein